MITVRITGMQQMSYYVICDSSFVYNSFEWGEAILILIATGILLIGAIKSRFLAFGGRGIEYNIFYILTFNISLVIGGIISIFSIKTATILALIISWIMSILAVAIIIDELIYVTIKK
jgi:hypothetical protein